jgi:glutamate dehydrogenase (NADP+)
LKHVMYIKNEKRGRISEYTEKYPNAKFIAGERPWSVKCDIALPCATQNELDGDEARELIKNGCMCISEGANMPSTPEAIHEFQKGKILFAPGKASNAGGVATSGLEMSQNSLRLSWSRKEVDDKLQDIMEDIHDSCVQYGENEDGTIDYIKGANIAGFVKVADAMLAQGIV